MNDVIAADGDLVIRRMRDEADEFERMVAWRNRPHVREWWDPDDPPLTVARAAEELRPSLERAEPTASCIIEVAGQPVGFIQFYPWDTELAYLNVVGVTIPEGAWGLDIFIGEPTKVGRGIGSRTVRLLSDHLFADRGATAVALITEADNARAQAAYRRAGMGPVGGPFRDTDTRDGQRVESILMIRARPGGTAGGQ